jgi:hypothetical protein
VQWLLFQNSGSSPSLGVPFRILQVAELEIVAAGPGAMPIGIALVILSFFVKN